MNSDQYVRIISRNGEFWLDKDGWTFSLSPPELVKLSLPPNVEGLDWFVRQASSLKNIESEFMKIRFSDSLFLGCDANLSYISPDFGGWIYSIEKEFLEFANHRKMWICGQMKLYFDNPPQKLFISLEKETK